MKIRVVNKELPCYDKELKVLNMNYDMIVAKGEEEKIKLNKADVELIPENPYEDIIMNYKDVIKIKLDKTISVSFYYVLINTLKQRVGEDIRQIEVLQDRYHLIKKGLWEKNLILVINDKTPLEVNVIGRNYGKFFDIVMKDISLTDFVNNCCIEMDMLRCEISEKSTMINRYRNILEKIINNSIISKEDVKKLPKLKLY